MIQVYRKILGLLDRRDRRRFAGLAGLTVLLGVFDAAGVVSILPFLAVAADPSVLERNAALARLYAASGAASTQDFATLLGLVVLGVLLCTIAMRVLVAFVVTRFIREQIVKLGRRLLDCYLHRPYGWFLQHNTATLASRLLQEVALVVNGPVTHAMNVLTSAAVVLAIALTLIVVDPVVALTGVAVLGLCYAGVFVSVRSWMNRLGDERVRHNRERFEVVQEAMGGVKDVKLLGLEQRYVERFVAPASALARIQTVSAIVSQMPRHALEALCFGGILTYVIHLLRADSGGLMAAIPVLGLYAFAGVRLFPVIQSLYGSLVQLRVGGAALDALHDDLHALEAPRPAPAGPAPMAVTREIALEDVSFAFPDANRPALDGLTMRIPARRRVGVVGATGAGKTTAIDILMGLLDPQAGALTVDGVAIDVGNLRRWRRSVGYVPQSIYLADDSVAGNIAFGLDRAEIDRAAVERAARVARLHDFVMTLPQGYDTIVGERGARLSGGQRQRVGIARALYADPAVLVFDEATSALDNVTEKAVIEAVETIGREKTIVMIAHRLSTVRRCDVIFYLEHGRVAAQGDYDTLVRTCKGFRDLHEAAA